MRFTMKRFSRTTRRFFTFAAIVLFALTLIGCGGTNAPTTLAMPSEGMVRINTLIVSNAEPKSGTNEVNACMIGSDKFTNQGKLLEKTTLLVNSTAIGLSDLGYIVKTDGYEFIEMSNGDIAVYTLPANPPCQPVPPSLTVDDKFQTAVAIQAGAMASSTEAPTQESLGFTRHLDNRELGGTLCVGEDENGRYSYNEGDGVTLFHPSYPYMEKCQSDGRLMIIQVVAPWSCTTDNVWNADWSGSCKDNTGTTITWPAPEPIYEGGN